jgi:two-component system nitrate/nitrite response regulator NarL
VRLVLAGDHRLFIDVLAAAFSRSGVTVAARASTSHEVLSELSRHEPDICLLAAHFPLSGALDLLPVIAAQHPSVRVLVLSEDADPAFVAAAVDGGAAGVIRKGQNTAELIEILHRVLAGEHALGAASARPHGRIVSEPAAISPEHLMRLLTLREREVLLLMTEGAGTKQIARSLAISVSTARTHVQRVLVKLGAHSQLEASSMAAAAACSILPAGPYQARRTGRGSQQNRPARSST